MVLGAMPPTSASCWKSGSSSAVSGFFSCNVQLGNADGSEIMHGRVWLKPHEQGRSGS
jgi:hypothetical protein